MTFRSDISVQWNLSPRIITVAAPSTEITIQDLHDTLREIEAYAENMAYPTIISSAGKESLGGGVYVGLTSTLLNAKVTFEARKTPTYSGTITSTDTTGRIITDSGATFITDGIEPGAWIINYVDGSICSVLTIDSETQITTNILDDGIDNKFEIGDTYRVQNVIQCAIAGGNLVAVDSNNADMSPVLPSAGTQIIKTSSASATLQELVEIQYGAFNDKVVLDISSPYSGTDYPVGTGRVPVNNVSDAITIAQNRGFDTLHIEDGDLVIQSGDIVNNFIFTGMGVDKTHITAHEAAIVSNCTFKNCTLTGTLDGGTSVKDARIYDLTYLDGEVFSSLISGTIKMGGDGIFLDCWSGHNDSTSPIIDFSGSNSNVIMRNYNGGVEIRNRNLNGYTSIDLNSGYIKLDSSCTTGTFTIRGSGILEDNSTNTVVNSNGLINTTTIAQSIEKNTIDIKFLFETKFGSHAGFGNCYFWDPINGLDTNDGMKPITACKTFTYIHNTLVTSGHHDVVFLTGIPARYVVQERIVISKDDVSLRGPGRYVFVTAPDISGSTMTISGRGVSVSGMLVTTLPSGSNTGVDIIAPATSIKLKEFGAYQCTGNGIKIVSGSQHILDDVLSYQNGGDGIQFLNTLGPKITGKSLISGNSQYGVRVLSSVPAGSLGVVLEDCTVGYNTMNELYIGTGSYTTVVNKSCLLDQQRITNLGVLTYIEPELVQTYQANKTDTVLISGSVGAKLNTILASSSVAINALVAGTTSAQSGSTNTYVRTTLTQSDGFFDGMLATVIGGAGAVVRTISYYQNLSGTLNFENELPFIPNINDIVYILANRNDSSGRLR